MVNVNVAELGPMTGDTAGFPSALAASAGAGESTRIELAAISSAAQPVAGLMAVERMRSGTLECILTRVRTSHHPIGGQAVLP